MKERIMGSEGELGIDCSEELYREGIEVAQNLPAFLFDEGFSFQDIEPLFLQRCDGAERFKDAKLHAVKGMGCGGLDWFLSNGDRIYYDRDRFEYSSRECTSIRDVVAAEHAMLFIVEGLLKKFQRMHACYGEITGFKDTTDGNVSYGAHENLLTLRALDFNTLVGNLVPLLVVRQLICGSGYVRKTPLAHPANTLDHYFTLSQRTPFIQDVMSPDTHNNCLTGRAIVNTRDEPLLDNKGYRRLHLIVGDANICGYTIALKFGLDHLGLRLCEEVQGFKVPSLADPVAALKQVSEHPYWDVPFADGTHLPPIEILERYYLRVYERYLLGSDAQTDWVYREVSSLLEPLAESKTKLPLDLVGKIDWVTKFEFLSRFIEKGDEKRGLDLQRADDLAGVRSCQNMYHCMSLERGLLPYLGDSFYYPANPDIVLQFIFEPCYTTRSSLRAFPITFFPEDVHEAYWNYVLFSPDGEFLNLNQSAHTETGDMLWLYREGPTNLAGFINYCKNKGLISPASMLDEIRGTKNSNDAFRRT